MELTAIDLSLALELEVANNSTDTLSDMSSEKRYRFLVSGFDLQTVQPREVLGDGFYRRSPVRQRIDGNTVDRSWDFVRAYATKARFTW